MLSLKFLLGKFDVVFCKNWYVTRGVDNACRREHPFCHNYCRPHHTKNIFTTNPSFSEHCFSALLISLWLDDLENITLSLVRLLVLENKYTVEEVKQSLASEWAQRCTISFYIKSQAKGMGVSALWSASRCSKRSFTCANGGYNFCIQWSSISWWNPKSPVTGSSIMRYAGPLAFIWLAWPITQTAKKATSPWRRLSTHTAW